MTNVEPGYFFLLPCSVCGRNFKPESISRHQSVCEKNAQKKRPVFDSSKQRLNGTDIPVSPTVVSPPSVNKRSYSSITPSKKRQSKWKEQHNDLIRSVRAAKGVQGLGETTPVIGPTFRKRTTNVFQALPDDCMPCPYCERSFGGKSFDRHLEWCKDQRTRLPSSPTDQTTVAKERLEARVKYRAPAPKRSLRDLTREKYSPTRNVNQTASPPSSFNYTKSPASLYSSQSGHRPDSNKSCGGSQSSLNSKLSAAVSTGATSFSRASAVDSELSSIRSGQSQKIQLPAKTTPIGGVGRSPSNLGSSFTRNTGSRYSLRSLPSQQKEVKQDSVPSRSPFNAGALRASLRLKQSQPAHVETPVKAGTRHAKPVLGTQTIGRNFSNKIKSLAASPVLSRRNVQPTRPSVLDIFSPGKRAEPDGIESMMTASCIQLDSSKKDSSVQRFPAIKDEKKISKDAYDPYISAQKQMEDLLDSVTTFTAGSSKTPLPLETPESPIEPMSKERGVVVAAVVESKEKSVDSQVKETQPVVQNTASTERTSFFTLPRKNSDGDEAEKKDLRSLSVQYGTSQRSPRSTFASLFRSDSSTPKERKDSADSDISSPKRSTSIPRPVYSRSNSTVQDAESMLGTRSPVVSRKYARSRSQAPGERLSPNGEASEDRSSMEGVSSPDAPKPVFPRTAAVFRHEPAPLPPPRKSLQTVSARRREQMTPSYSDFNGSEKQVSGMRLDDQSRQRVAALEADLKQILSGISELGLLSKSSFEPQTVLQTGVKSSSKFCHCCGSPYPVAAAKFCCVCGEKRL